MRKSFQREIDGLKFEILQHPATEGINLMTRVIRVVGRLLQDLSQEEEVLDREVSFALLGQAIDVLLTHMNEEYVIDTIKLAVKYCSLIDEKGEKHSVEKEFDDLFAGEYGTLGKLLLSVFEVNFKQVFSLAGIAENLRGPAAS